MCVASCDDTDLIPLPTHRPLAINFAIVAAASATDPPLIGLDATHL